VEYLRLANAFGLEVFELLTPMRRRLIPEQQLGTEEHTREGGKSTG
jgi:hypothetical protein